MSKPLFHVRSSCGTTYDIAQSIDAARATRRSLPHTEMLSCQIYLQLGDGLYNYETLAPKFIASLLDTTERSIELDQMNTRLIQEGDARWGQFALLERVAKLRGHEGAGL